MLEVGKIQELKIVKKVEFGVYLSEDEDSEDKVLLPSKQVPDGADTGSCITAFIYRDSKDRMIATVRVPLITCGHTAVLECTDIGKIGAFLNMGLERDLFLPYHEMTSPAHKGDRCLVAMYVDKSGRLAATEKVYDYLLRDSGYKKDDEVEGTIY